MLNNHEEHLDEAFIEEQARRVGPDGKRLSVSPLQDVLHHIEFESLPGDYDGDNARLAAARQPHVRR